MTDTYATAREKMVQEQLVPRGISDPGTLGSMGEVPRHLFVPENLVLHAYEDGPLAIGEGQTISQPYIVALMTQHAQLSPDSVALEIGTGSGYGAAVLSQIARNVYTVERIPSLADEAKARLDTLGYSNVEVKVADGTLGWPEKGPFDAILVTASAPEVPEALLEQLKVGGRLIVPIGDLYSQKLVSVKKGADGGYDQKMLGDVRFVPLIGEQGWK